MNKEKSRIFIPFLFIFSFMVVLAVSFYANSFTSFSMRTMEYNVERRLITESRRLSDIINIEELDQYRNAEDMELPEYQVLRKRLVDFARDADILYAYFIRPADGGKLQYIVDNDFDEETRVGLDTPPIDLDEEPAVKDALEGKAVSSGLGNYSAGWDGLLTAYAPMFNQNGEVAAIAGVDIRDENIVQTRHMIGVLTAVQIITVIVMFVSCFIGIIFFHRRNEMLNALSITDELTKLNNRRSFMEYMNLIWRQNRRLKLPMSILMIDVDYFKKYNDSLGHLEGDKTLIAIAQCLKTNVKRETDFVARFGGEEFVCLLPFLEKDKALQFAKTLVQRVEDMKITHPASDVSEFVTISAGVASVVPNENDSPTTFLDEADKALYTAKKTGRNRAVAN